MDMEDPGRYQTFWRRVAALFLDGAALAPLGWLDILIWNSEAGPLLLLAWVIFNALVFVGYEVGLVARFGQTPGKMACGVMIVTVDGGPVPPARAALRQIVPLTALVVFLFLQAQNILAGELANRALGSVSDAMWAFGIYLGWTLLEVVTMLTNPKRRAIHDFIAGTVVVRVTPIAKLVWVLVPLLVLELVVPRWLDDKNLRLDSRTDSVDNVDRLHPTSFARGFDGPLA